MFSRVLYFFLLLSVGVTGISQECLPPTLRNGTYLNANNIRALIPASGSLLWDDNDAQFTIQGADGGFATIFAHGLWFGALDPGGSTAIATATYGAGAGNSDYYPGPVAIDGTTNPDNCLNYDRAWTVLGAEIEAHLADFADNGIIDEPIPAILGWPGSGNPEFAALNGFELPSTSQGMAPFFDLGGDGSYNPLEGDYPYLEQSEVVPDQIVWSVFNTVGGFPYQTGFPNAPKLEIQMTAWAFNCSDNEVLSHTVFSSYKVINRATEAYNNVRMGLWTDFDLGCFTDDYMGSAPGLNTYYAYNRLPVDMICELGLPSAGENPPVQAITILSQPLDGYLTLGTIGPTEEWDVPSEAVNPDTPEDYLRLLNNIFADGVPITQGGSGYNPGSTEVVDHAYPGDPNDPEGWSEFALEIPNFDRKGLGTIELPGTFNSGSVYTVDVAYSFHRVTDAGHLGNVTEMYAGVAQLQAEYDAAFAGSCSQLVICTDDCIWSGDLNADGIANHEDLLTLGFELDDAGPARGAPYSWTPENGTSWGVEQLLNGADTKHLDADGDGQVLITDFDQTLFHYNNVRPDYVPEFEYPLGDDLTLLPTGGMSFENLEPGQVQFATVRLLTDIPDLRALAFTLEYDPVYFSDFEIIGAGFEENDIKLITQDRPGEIDMAHYVLEETENLETGALFLTRLEVIEIPDELLETDETFVRFRNIRAYLTDGTEVSLGAMSVRIQINDIAVNTEEPAWAEELNLYPNPVKDRIYWTTEAVRPEAYRLLNVHGQLMSSGFLNDNSLDVSNLSSGIYSIQLLRAEDMIVRKIIVEQ